MTSFQKLDRRAVLKGIAGTSLALPVLEAMGKEVAEQTPRRFCALYNRQRNVAAQVGSWYR